MRPVPFNRPTMVGHELDYIREAVEHLHLSADGPFSRSCCAWLEERTGATRAVLTHSCTGALELAALLLDLEPGDEVIMPSFTFATTASAVALRRAVPVFVDVRRDTLNLDETLVADAITPRTRAILAVHYAGVPCELDALGALANGRGLTLGADAAQALGSTFRGQPAAGIGSFAALSFHETKNVTSGQGGALLVNDPALAERAVVLRDKGTDRQAFFRGEVERYTWTDLGSSFGLSELNAAFLWAQLEHADEVLADRLRTWALYHEALAELEAEGRLRRPVVPGHVEHNGHIYYVLAHDLEDRTRLIEGLKEHGVNAVFHYAPLHDSPAGRRFGRAHGSLEVTRSVADRLVRLPLWYGMTESDVARVAEAVRACLGARASLAMPASGRALDARVRLKRPVDTPTDSDPRH
jgi:dTDP-4-amino-4,6-dideoxygalactose transaminase